MNRYVVKYVTDWNDEFTEVVESENIISLIRSLISDCESEITANYFMKAVKGNEKDLETIIYMAESIGHTEIKEIHLIDKSLLWWEDDKPHFAKGGYFDE